jgi:hypothetical protein
MTTMRFSRTLILCNHNRDTTGRMPAHHQQSEQVPCYVRQHTGSTRHSVDGPSGPPMAHLVTARPESHGHRDTAAPRPQVALPGQEVIWAVTAQTGTGRRTMQARHCPSADWLRIFMLCVNTARHTLSHCSDTATPVFGTAKCCNL